MGAAGGTRVFPTFCLDGRLPCSPTWACLNAGVAMLTNSNANCRLTSVYQTFLSTSLRSPKRKARQALTWLTTCLRNNPKTLKQSNMQTLIETPERISSIPNETVELTKKGYGDNSVA